MELLDYQALLPVMNYNDFKRICYEIANNLKFKIESFDFELEGKNFYSVRININNETVFLLLNAYYPYIAFASKVSPSGNIYVNSEKLSSKFRNFFHTLTISELERPLKNEEKLCLNQEELKQVKYYNPSTLAEVIFNYWD